MNGVKNEGHPLKDGDISSGSAPPAPSSERAKLVRRISDGIEGAEGLLRESIVQLEEVQLCLDVIQHHAEKPYDKELFGAWISSMECLLSGMEKLDQSLCGFQAWTTLGEGA